MILNLIAQVPSIRIRSLNHWPVQSKATYVLYWMTAFRRTRFNFALQRAVELANQLGKPLVILEAVRCNYRWASDRFHQFLLQGMHDNAVDTLASKAFYVAYVEPSTKAAEGLLATFASHASAIVSDDFPCFFHPAMFRQFANKCGCAFEVVDSNTIVPMRSADRTFTVAHSYRRYMQKEVFRGMPDFPAEFPLEQLAAPKLERLPQEITSTWPVWESKEAIRNAKSFSLSGIDIDHSVSPTEEKGGVHQAAKALNAFADSKLSQYAIARNEPEQQGSSWLSPYLHFGHLSPHEVFLRIAAATGWSPSKLAKPNGKMNGFWDMGDNAEAFLDQLMTWREIGFNMCWRESNYHRYESLPSWAKKTLDEHSRDERPITYELFQFEQALTHDPLWNAAQRQLVRDGRIHNYLRMLWGKKILHWSKSPQEALKIMIELNNKYALDGRDPNSYSGIFWTLGRYDRAWGPERPIFGKIRYMTSESTQNKFHVKQYIQKYS